MSNAKDVAGDDHEFWRLVMESQAASGLSISKFCENESINQSSFYQWRKKLDQKSDSVVNANDSESSVEPEFIPLGQIHTNSKELCVTFPGGIYVNASNSCNIKLLCETVRTICEQQC
ncbi:MAG: hypothetical protein A2Y10_20235 [Planctomycetes bacterium GWF2_41_51]|nr:MAG: hypothetical protein A2Y10_20235 [Planctomycetes bacterium GWF2_41_51]HBG26994.1 hypothetical protein [Phycisphaerales bacterium]